MNAYCVRFVFDDSSVLEYSVMAKSEEGAINCILNNTKTVKQPKFVLMNTVDFIQSDDDVKLVKDFSIIHTQFGNMYKFKNKLAEVVDVGGISICLGSLLEYKDLIKGEDVK